MSAAAAEPVVADGAAPALPKKGKKKLIILVAVALLVLAGVGGGATMLIKKRHAAQAAEIAATGGDAEGAAEGAAPPKKESHPHGPPTFLPLDPFIVNLADRDSERFAQIGITLELDDPHFADKLKAYMPSIRSGILMVISSKTSQELLTRAGKEKLAAEVMRESLRPLGITLDENAESTGKFDDSHSDEERKVSPDDSPVRRVNFSSFIIQ